MDDDKKVGFPPSTNKGVSKSESRYRASLNQLFMYMTAVIIIVAVTGVIIATIRYSKNYKHNNAHISALTSQIDDFETRIAECEQTKLDLETCLKKAGDPVKRNVLDMQEYIAKRYPRVPKELAEIIAIRTNKLCSQEKIAFPLVVGLMEVESHFNPFAKSSANARGLLQVRYKIWKEKLENVQSENQLHGIEDGIKSGLWVLKHYIEKNKGNITKALQNYNGTKGNEYHTKVYDAIGRFTAFRTNTYGEDTENPAESINEQEDRNKPGPGNGEGERGAPTTGAPS